MPNWYHFNCFFVKQRPKTVADIAHFESVRWEDQEKIKAKLGNFSNLVINNFKELYLVMLPIAFVILRSIV